MCLVLLCAGSSSRFGKKKQLVEVNGFPLFLHTLMRFSGMEWSHIVLVVPEEDVDFFLQTLGHFTGCVKKNQKNNPDQKWWEHHKNRISCIAGGSQRWGSSAKAISHLKKVKSSHGEIETVVIHDGARPLLDGDDLKLMLTKWDIFSKCASTSEKKKFHGLVAAYPLVDTIKRVEKVGDDLFIKEHPRRGDYLSVATPQIFDFQALEKSYQQVLLRGFEKSEEPTDDAEVVGKHFPIALCLLQHPNPKLTYAHQLDAFEKALAK